MNDRNASGPGSRAVILLAGLAGALLLSGCETAAELALEDKSALRAQAHERMPQRLALLAEAQAACEELRKSDGDRPWSKAADCYNRRIAGALEPGQPAYLRYVFTNTAERARISDRVDRGLITPEQARAQLNTADTGMIATVKAVAAAPPLTPLQREHSQEMDLHAELVQVQDDANALMKQFEAIKPPP